MTIELIRFMVLTALSVTLLVHFSLITFILARCSKIVNAWMLLAVVFYSALWAGSVVGSILAPDIMWLALRYHFGIGMLGFLYLYLAHFPKETKLQMRHLAVASFAFAIALLAFLPNAIATQLDMIGYGYQNTWDGWLYPIARFAIFFSFISVIIVLVNHLRNAKGAAHIILSQLTISVCAILLINLLLVSILPYFGITSLVALTPVSNIILLMTITTFIVTAPMAGLDAQYHARVK
ncbi:hypothetical protein A3C89_00655 [Candidatus Kaiserbacteria bacterium RIFCSPHIGHO2_02_FULL_50_50]|uniref:Uncharacterized protein n=1 Tax=Candidatus Kaiserbacteria bacterium RIFCSPHIGHO2_02_FULL_50_50 TaxID=1798492 RepID=A0A1F6DFQ0_9BACT|nr:MAG: hypothetical protein A3C89_00655 [Candidatus Kaiserbacteria bacterium RIFCSPHIGHO2_02_FULL_50_50]OGG88862.1 MAG: hypothetical protein A3G62_03095 [Candidatus Kaiserbacteria bacterium RIFCSPLOWO2_12_FULL_50_10]